MMLKKYLIDQNKCVGCTKCLAPCPTDAIVGADEQLHIIMPEFCIGCGLCVPPCPMDCISVIETDNILADKEIIKTRSKLHKERLQNRREQKDIRDKRSKIDKKDLLSRIISQA